MSTKCCLIRSAIAAAIIAILFSSLVSIAHAQAAPAELDKPFELKAGQQAAIESEGITVSFLDVVEDSRCPSDVVCIQAGQATIGVSVGANSTSAERHNLTVGPKGNESATFGQYSVRLVKLDPYPVSTVQTSPEDYVATLVVSKARISHPGIVAGQIASVQMGSDGRPEWIQSGIWVMRGLSMNSSDMPDLSFISRMTMVMTDGTALHSHGIYDFKSSGQKTEGNVLTINGTATVTMRNGPVQDVPLSIQISNMTTVAVRIGPEKVESHFGNDPVYGVVSNPSRADIGGKAAQTAGMGSQPRNSTAAGLEGIVRKDVNYYGNSTGYLAYPENANGTLPGVVMVHEWWGLNQNIKNMAEELASKGYVVLAADLYGGRVATDAGTAQQLSGAVRNNQQGAIKNLNAAVEYLASQKNVDDSKIASLGWCFGGGQSLQLALNAEKPLAATVIYYGNLVTDKQQLATITWPVLGIFGSADQSIPVDSVKQFEAALDANGTPNEIHIYEGAGHAFANPSGDNYAPEETQDAWQKTLAFLGRYL